MEVYIFQVISLPKYLFPDHDYISLERPDIRERAQTDPQRFLRAFKNGVILDEAQRVPELFSYLQVIVDEQKKMGKFILTGSQNFLLSQHISQSLSGRVMTFRLLPMSFAELHTTAYALPGLDDYLWHGFYPAIYDRSIPPYMWYQTYLETYIERDVRHIRNITNLALFQKFLSLCAGRIGQLLNMNSLAGDCGLSHNTIEQWLSVLEASFVAFRLQPYHKNLGKRICKQPKLYFYDVGLAAFLLGIEKQEQLTTHYMRGNLVENCIVTDYMKYRLNQGKRFNGYFWRDRYGHEIDLFIESHTNALIEIKSGETMHPDYIRNIAYWKKIAAQPDIPSYVVYGGNETCSYKDIPIVSWHDVQNEIFVQN